MTNICCGLLSVFRFLLGVDSIVFAFSVLSMVFLCRLNRLETNFRHYYFLFLHDLVSDLMYCLLFLVNHMPAHRVIILCPAVLLQMIKKVASFNHVHRAHYAEIAFGI